MFVTARTLPALLGPTIRAMRWGPFAVATGLGLAILTLPAILSDRLTAGHVTTLLRLTAACGALGVAFLLDDPSTRSVSTVPTSRLVRQVVRAGAALPVIAAGWAAALATATLGVGVTGLPRGGLTLEAATLVAVAYAMAATGLRFTSDGYAGVVAAPALLMLVAVLWFVPDRVAFVLPPTDPQWTFAHRRWAALLVTAVVVFVWASRESTARRARVATTEPRT